MLFLFVYAIRILQEQQTVSKPILLPVNTKHVSNKFLNPRGVRVQSSAYELSIYASIH